MMEFMRSSKSLPVENLPTRDCSLPSGEPAPWTVNASCARRFFGCLRNYLAALLLLVTAGAAFGQQLEWQRTLGWEAGGPSHLTQAMAVDASGVYVAGALGPSQGGSSLIAKYGADGRLLWSRAYEFLPAGSRILDIAVDATGVYLVGYSANLPVTVNRGFVARLNLDGRLIWSREPSRPTTQLTTIALHTSGVYVGGAVRRGFGVRALMSKLDRNGNEGWFSVFADIRHTIDELAVDDSGVYAAPLDDFDVVKFDFAGRRIAGFSSSGNPRPVYGLAVDATGIYVGFRGREIRKYAHDGPRLWVYRPTHGAAPNDLALDASGVYVIGTVGKSHSGTAVVSKLTLDDGNELWSHFLDGPDETAIPNIAVRDGRVLVSGSFEATTPSTCTLFDEFCFTAYVAKLSQELPPQLQALSGNGGRPQLAVLRHDYTTSDVTIVVKDAATGSVVRSIACDRNYRPQQLLRLPDGNGNGSDELAVLGIQRTTGRVTAEVRDAGTGALITRVPFGFRWVPKQLAALPDVNGNDTPDLALVQQTAYQYTDAQVRDGVTGASIARFSFGRLTGEPQLAALPDRNGNGVPELAVLVGVSGVGLGPDYQLQVNDAVTGALLSQHSFTGLDAQPLFTALPDTNGDGAVELALLSSRSGSWLAEVYFSPFDPSAPDRLVQFNGTGIPRYLSVVPDLNGNRYPDLAVLRANSAPGQSAVHIKDPLTDARIRVISFPSDGWLNRGLAVLPDLNGNRKSEVVVLQQRKSDDVVRSRIHDAFTGALIRTIDF